MCDEWLHSFATFLDDMGAAPTGLTLDRRDNDKGYNKDNCRWATRREQQQNMRTNRNITHAGKTQCAAEWARERGIKYITLLTRLYRGWSVERALTP